MAAGNSCAGPINTQQFNALQYKAITILSTLIPSETVPELHEGLLTA